MVCRKVILITRRCRKVTCSNSTWFVLQGSDRRSTELCFLQGCRDSVHRCPHLTTSHVLLLVAAWVGLGLMRLICCGFNLCNYYQRCVAWKRGKWQHANMVSSLERWCCDHTRFDDALILVKNIIFLAIGNNNDQLVFLPKFNAGWIPLPSNHGVLLGHQIELEVPLIAFRGWQSEFFLVPSLFEDNWNSLHCFSLDDPFILVGWNPRFSISNYFMIFSFLCFPVRRCISNENDVFSKR